MSPLPGASPSPCPRGDSTGIIVLYRCRNRNTEKSSGLHQVIQIIDDKGDAEIPVLGHDSFWFCFPPHPTCHENELWTRTPGISVSFAI